MIRIYRIPFSTNVERVALAAAHKGLDVEWIEVDPADRSPVRAASGQDLVPVAIFEDGSVLADSPAILEELERRHPDPPLYPLDEPRATEERLFVDWFNRVWKTFPNGIADGIGDRAEHAARMRSAVDGFEALLTGRDFLLGDFGLADVTAFPFLKYAAFGLPEGDDERFHAILVEHQPLSGDSPLRAWAERVDAHPRS
jgi:glutathione S-transferase